MVYGIVAIDDKRGLANDVGIPWDLPSDKKYFRDKTINRAIFMGYKTYEEFKEPLLGRENYVATLDTKLHQGFYAVNNVQQFIKGLPEDIWIIGGAGLFKSVWESIDSLFITHVFGDFACTKFLPEYKNNFRIVERSKQFTEHDIQFRFEVWTRNS